MEENYSSSEEYYPSDLDSEGEVIFESSFHCYPISIINKPNLEMGNKIIMPPSALDNLIYLGVKCPMLFEMEKYHNNNNNNGRISHCGVLEFTAEEGNIYVPHWMMENMHLQDGEIVNLKSTNLEKGTFFKLQPHTKDFFDISDPKTILEISLGSFSCLTTGDTIMILHNNKEYYIDVTSLKSRGQEQESSSQKAEKLKFQSFTGKKYSLRS